MDARAHPIAIPAAVAAGAALGSVARYLASLAMLHLAGPGLPLGTLMVNVTGSFLIGLCFTVSEPGGRLPAGPVTRQFVLTGFCGGFTTFSVFSLETVLMVQRGEVGLAAATVAASVFLWLAAVWGGARTGMHLNRR